MPETIIVQFASGNTVRFGSSEGGGLSEVGFGDTLVEKTEETLAKAMSALGDVVSRLEAEIGKLEKRPDSVEVEFGASLKGKCDLWVVSGDGEAEFKVTLGWGKAK